MFRKFKLASLTLGRNCLEMLLRRSNRSDHNIHGDVYSTLYLGSRDQPRLTIVCVVIGCNSASHHTTKGLVRPILSTRAACGCSASKHITWRDFDLAQPGATYPMTEKLAAFGMWLAAVTVVSVSSCFTSTHHAHYLGFHDVHLFFAPEFRACDLCLPLPIISILYLQSGGLFGFQFKIAVILACQISHLSLSVPRHCGVGWPQARRAIHATLLSLGR